MFDYHELGEQKLIWCRGTVDKVVKRNDKEIKAVVKWNKDDIGGGDASTSTELLKKPLECCKAKGRSLAARFASLGTESRLI